MGGQDWNVFWVAVKSGRANILLNPCPTSFYAPVHSEYVDNMFALSAISNSVVIGLVESEGRGATCPPEFHISIKGAFRKC